MEPNFVAIEATVCDFINLTQADVEEAAEFSAFRDKLLASAVGAELFRRTLKSLQTSEHPNSVLFNCLAMGLLAGWKAGVGSSEVKMLEEMFR